MQEEYLKIKVIPNAALTEERGKMADGTLKLSVAAAPEKNRANIELIRYFSDKYKTEKANIKIISGHSSRLKLLKVTYEKKVCKE